MAKKRLLIIFAILLAIALLVVLGGALFTLKKAALYFVSYDDATGKTVYIDAPQGYETLTAQSLAKEAEGKSVFFFSSAKLIDSIQKSHSTLRVVGLRRVFPDKVEIFVTQRTPVAYFEVNGSYYLVDEELYIMEYRTSPFEGYIYIDFGDRVSSTQTVGESVKLSSDIDIKTATANVLDALWQVYFDYVEMPNLIKSISFDVYKNNESLVLETKTGALIWIVNPTKDASKKVVEGVSVYGNNTDGDKTGVGVNIYCFDPDSNRVVTSD